ncbi:DUF1616 domain-containing protein [Haloarchaeobius sp. DFWS5]|uniref:DUF1616 domain-containing protein n=1 Tax=Haloarchaeobius sp. DFWS5 TaxID=3446114 RepID=UPI003EB9AF93
MSRTKLWFLDALVVLALTAVSGAAIWMEIPGVRIAGTALLVLLLPGYAATTIVFPRRRTAGSTSASRTAGERFGVSVALSLALVSLVTLVANFTPWGITVLPIVVGTCALTGVLAVLGLLVRWRVTAEDRYAFVVPLGALAIGSDRDEMRGDSTAIYNIVLAVSVLFAIASVGFAAAYTPSGTGFTDLAVDSEGQTAQQTAVLEGGESPTMVVENHEGSDQQYTMVVLSQQVQEGENGEAVVQSEQELTRNSMSVGAGERATTTLDVNPGGNRVVVLLYQGDAPSDPSRESAYRVVTLRVA